MKGLGVIAGMSNRKHLHENILHLLTSVCLINRLT